MDSLRALDLLGGHCPPSLGTVRHPHTDHQVNRGLRLGVAARGVGRARAAGDRASSANPVTLSEANVPFPTKVGPHLEAVGRVTGGR